MKEEIDPNRTLTDKMRQEGTTLVDLEDRLPYNPERDLWCTVMTMYFMVTGRELILQRLNTTKKIGKKEMYQVLIWKPHIQRN